MHPVVCCRRAANCGKKKCQGGSVPSHPRHPAVSFSLEGSQGTIPEQLIWKAAKGPFQSSSIAADPRLSQVIVAGMGFHMAVRNGALEALRRARLAGLS